LGVELGDKSSTILTVELLPANWMMLIIFVVDFESILKAKIAKQKSNLYTRSVFFGLFFFFSPIVAVCKYRP